MNLQSSNILSYIESSRNYLDIASISCMSMLKLSWIGCVISEKLLRSITLILPSYQCNEFFISLSNINQSDHMAIKNEQWLLFMISFNGSISNWNFEFIVK